MPAWSRTMHLTRPWNVNTAPPLLDVPFDELCPEAIIKGDLFHIIKVGCARDIIGGCVFFLAKRGFWDLDGATKNLPDRLDRAYSSFKLFCKASHLNAGLRSFSKAFFNAKMMLSAPWINSKGSDSTLLLKWPCFFISLNLQHPATPCDATTQEIMRVMLKVCRAVLSIFDIGSFAQAVYPKGLRAAVVHHDLPCTAGIHFVGCEASHAAHEMLYSEAEAACTPPYSLDTKMSFRSGDASGSQSRNVLL